MSQSVKPWVKGLNLKESDFQTWSYEVPPGMSVTDWALEHKKIPSNEYLAWAKDFYQLPVLQNEFTFSADALTALEPIKAMGIWNSQMVPIAQWDNVVFVACTEPKSEVQWSFPVQYVLASPSLLNKTWEALNGPSQTVPVNLSEVPPAPQNMTPPEEPSVIELPSSTNETKENLGNEVDAEDLARLRHTANCDDFDPSPVFKDLQQQFVTAQILVFEGERQLKTLLNENSWKPESDKAFEAFDISKPCIFRIVQKSGHPYHGPIAPNEINNKFFAYWGYQKLPEHVTLCPIKYEEGLAGMLLCIGNDESTSLKSLSYAEQAAERFKPIIEKKVA